MEETGTCSRRCLKIVAVLLSPFVLGLLALWAWIGSLRAIYVVHAFVALYSYFNGVSSSDDWNRFRFNGSASDLLVLALLQLVVGWWSKTDLTRRYPSTLRRSVAVLYAIGCTVYVSCKWAAFDTATSAWQQQRSALECLLASAIVFPWIGCLHEFWVPTSFAQLIQAEQALLRQQKLGPITAKTAAGISFVEYGALLDDLATASASEEELAQMPLTLNATGAGTGVGSAALHSRASGHTKDAPHVEYVNGKERPAAPASLSSSSLSSTPGAAEQPLPQQPNGRKRRSVHKPSPAERESKAKADAHADADAASDTADTSLLSASPPSPTPNSVTRADSKPILVLLHGYGGGKGIWCVNFAALSLHFHIYALDMRGVGLSQRQPFSVSSLRRTNGAPPDRPASCGPKRSARITRVEDAETFFVEALEEWRAAMGLERFILLGHSFGGYMAAIYALRYPQRVSRLILASPVGVPRVPQSLVDTLSLSSSLSAISWSIFSSPRQFLFFLFGALWEYRLTPQTILRFAGPVGPWVIRKAMTYRLGHVFEDGTVEPQVLCDYLYHLNAGPPSGEHGLNVILYPMAYARSPLVTRLNDLQCPTWFMYGQHDWMHKSAGEEVVQALKQKAAAEGRVADAGLIVVAEAGHQLFLEHPQNSLTAILRICSQGNIK